MTETVVLREYETVDVEMDGADARGLAAAAGSNIAVTVGSSPGKWQLTAGGVVGSVVTSNVTVLIRPKVMALHNLFLLLDVGIPAEAWAAETFPFGTDPDLLPAISAFFVRAASQALARGPVRGYRSFEERLVTIRGRIDIPTQLQTPGISSPIACRYDDWTADIIENAAIRAATRRLLCLPGVRPDTRRGLQRLLAGLDEVADADVRPEMVDRISITRLNAHYEPALRLSTLILRNTSLVDQVGIAPASSFLLETPRLFQEWITDRLSRHLQGHLDVLPEPSVDLGEHGRVRMEPDLVFRRSGVVAYVGDIKYKLSAGLGRSGDYYQLLAYMTALHLDEGVLIYCDNDAENPDSEVVVQATGSRLFAHRVALGGTTAGVEEAVARLAEWIRHRSTHIPAMSA